VQPNRELRSLFKREPFDCRLYFRETHSTELPHSPTRFNTDKLSGAGLDESKTAGPLRARLLLIALVLSNWSA
jgi:hypothetical protein